MIALSLGLSLSLTSLPEKLPSQALYFAFRSWVEKTQGCNESAFFKGGSTPSAFAKLDAAK